MTELLYALGFAVLFNLIMFGFAYRRKTDKLTDVSYAATFIGLVVYGLYHPDQILFSQGLLAFMIVVWAVRIGVFLFVRIGKSGRDKRFDGRRDHFMKFLSFWLLQAMTAWAVMSGAILFMAIGARPITSFMLVGFFIWLAGFIIESVADMQKFSFSQQKMNKDKWIQSGLWKYSRHPNYFGEILVWFGVFVFVVSGLTGTEQLLAMVSPLFISFMLLFVSGVPLLEKSADKQWGSIAAYKKYKESTSILIPAPPKK